ncbi:hypothetical protein ACOMHN_008365 [Nucella lapillus]
MAKRRLLPAYVPTLKDNASEVTDSESTERKTVWISSPVPNTPRTLVSQMDGAFKRLDRLEERLDIVQSDLSAHLDVQRHGKEVDQSRQEVQVIKKQMEDAFQRLQSTQTTLDNLTKQSTQDHAQIRALEVEKEELHQLVEKLTTKLDERDKKICRLERQVADVHRTLKDNANKQAALGNQMQQQQQQMQQVLQDQQQMQQLLQNIVACSPALASISPLPQPARDTVTSPQRGIVAESPTQQSGNVPLSSRTRKHTGTLGLPPIQLSQTPGGRMNNHGGPKYNFPPK